MAKDVLQFLEKVIYRFGNQSCSVNMKQVILNSMARSNKGCCTYYSIPTSNLHGLSQHWSYHLCFVVWFIMYSKLKRLTKYQFKYWGHWEISSRNKKKYKSTTSHEIILKHNIRIGNIYLFIFISSSYQKQSLHNPNTKIYIKLNNNRKEVRFNSMPALRTIILN